MSHENDGGANNALVVVVHGAWSDGSSWSGVVRRLHELGIDAQAAPNPLRGIPADSEYLRAYLATIGRPVVLVGHSYGGVVITNAATEAPNVKALAYVGAFVPDEGESIAQLAGAVPGSVLAPAISEPTTVLTLRPFPGAPDGVADSYVRREVFITGFAHDVEPAVAAALAATQMPLATSAFVEHSGPPAWKSIPSWALVGTADRVIPPVGQAFMAERAGAQTSHVDASHLSMISRPEDVAAFIKDAAVAVG